MNYREFIETHLKEASKTAMRLYGTVSGSVKGADPNQVLTEADTAVGEYLVNAVKQQFSDHNIIDEESGVVDNGSQFTWVIDPIDGTSNFAVGTPDWGIMIGLLDGVKPIAGGIIAPVHGELYVAQEGRGATKNGETIHVTKETELINTLVAFGIDSNQEQPDVTQSEARVVPELVLSVRNIRGSGSEPIDPMRIADGRYGGRVNFSGKIWDNVAVQIIVEESGGLHTDHDGKPLDYSDPLQKSTKNYSTVTASPLLHKQLIEILKKVK